MKPLSVRSRRQDCGRDETRYRRESAMRSIFLLLFALNLYGQPPTFTSDVNVVNLLATVTGRDGRIVMDLTAEDFSLQEDGRPQRIRYFSQQSDLAITIGLLVDTSQSQRRVLEPEREASFTFLNHILRPETDLAFVFHFDYQVEMLQGLTASHEELAAALDRLNIPRTEGTLLFEAVKEASENVMRAQQGRKAFVILSDGHNFGGRTKIGTAIEYGQRADTIIYSIEFADMHIGHPVAMLSQQIYLADGRRSMRRLAQETGGGYFEVSKSKTIEQIYALIEDELRHQYSIGYAPDHLDVAGYHKITLRANRGDLTVRTRAGYYSK
jgi:VWFA-related protein